MCGYIHVLFSSVQSLDRVRLFATPWTAARQASLSITHSWSLPKLIQSEMPSNHLIFCHPLLLLPSIFLSVRVFSKESALCIRWPKYWNFSFNICPSNEHTYIRNKLSCITFSIINMANTFVNYVVSNSPSSLHEEKSAKLKFVVTKKRTIASYDLD